MTDLTPEKRAELRELIGESPDLPYRDSPGTHGNPSDGPTYVALEALWDGRWEEVATGDYARWNGMALALAAAAVNALPALLDAADERDRLAAQVERVRELDDPEREHKGHEIQTNVDRGPDGSAWSWDTKTCHCDRPWRHA